MIRKLSALTLGAAVALSTATAFAQEAGPASSGGDMPLAMGADLAFMLPMGDFGDASGPLLGAMFKLEHALSPNLGFTGRIGYLFGLEKEPAPGLKSSITDVPIWAGIKYYVSAPRDGFWVGAEAGLNYLTATAKGNVLGVEFEASDSEMKFGAGARAGYRLGAVDIGAGLTMLDLGEAGDSMAVLATVGYDFTGF